MLFSVYQNMGQLAFASLTGTDKDIGEFSVADPGFLTINHPVVTVTDRTRFCCRHI
jgi:hypothetical protein